MTSPEDINAWLKKMNYPGIIPSNEAIQDLCRGALGPIFQQIIDRVKPKREIEQIRNNILISQVERKSRIKKVKDSYEAIDLYEKKQQLEKKLLEVTESNEYNEENLKMLKSKFKSKNAKIQILKHKIHENEKEELIFRAKSANLEKRIDHAKTFKNEIEMLENSLMNKKNNDEQLHDKLTNLFDVIGDHIEFMEISSQIPKEKKFRSSNSVLYKPINTSMLLSSSKKPSSMCKNKATSSRRNIFDSVNNLFIGSTIRKKHSEKHSSTFFNSTALSSIRNNSKVMDKSTDTLVFDSVFNNNHEIRKNVEKIWTDYNPIQILETFREIKKNDKIKLMHKVAETKIYEENEIEDDDVMLLYSCHIKNELMRRQTEIKQNHLLEILNNKFNDYFDDFVNLQAIECGIKSSLVHLEENIEQLRRNNLDEDASIDNIISDTDSLQSEMINIKTRIENQLCLLYDSNSWLDKSYHNVQDIVWSSFPTIGEAILEDGASERYVEKFCSLPLHYNESYLDSWNEVYSNAELLEIIKNPSLSTEKIFMDVISQKLLLKKYEEFQKVKTERSDNFSDILNIECKKLDHSDVLYNLQKCNDKFLGILKRLDQTEDILKMQLSQPFNEFVSSDRKFNGKSLKEFIDEYDELYKQIS